MDRSPVVRARRGLGAAIAAVALAASACGSGSSTAGSTTSAPQRVSDHAGTASATPDRAMQPATRRPATTQPATKQTPKLLAAVVAYQTRQGIPRNHYQVTEVAFSPVDAGWARFSIVATPPYRGSFQNIYGVAHRVHGSWRVLSVGTAEVGCPPGRNVVPLRLRPGLSIVCPTTG